MTIGPAPIQERIALYGAAGVLFKILMGELPAPEELMIVGPANSGKSLPVGKALWAVLDEWPDTQICLLRKTRVSLNESFLNTFETEVLGHEHSSVLGKNREQRTRYVHPNGGVLRLAGYDDKRRLYSSQDHIIWVNEMTELTLREWERLHRGLRRPGGPGYYILGGDCNPDYGEHWANSRFPEGDGALEDGRLRLISRHEDNPSISKAYLRRLRRQLHGADRDRLYLGLWRSAEGQVYPMYDPDVHLLSARLEWPVDAYDQVVRGETVELHIQRGLEEDDIETRELRWFGASLDWGWDSPGSLSIWGLDGDRRGYQVAQVYRREKNLEWWANWAAELWEEFRFRFLVTDSADPVGATDYLNDFMAKKGMPRIAVKVKKPHHKVHGFNHVRWGLTVKDDGNPHLYFLRDNIRGGRDPQLVEDHLPCCTAEELPRLVLKKIRETEKGEVAREESDEGCADHGADELMYFWLHAWRKDLSKKAPRLKPDDGPFPFLKETAESLMLKQRRKRRTRL